eukprot:m.206635 g.206635  ORF g.206635 m.206635 type:complete len:446 (+) comp23430_c0_seq1:51-1388(+)
MPLLSGRADALAWGIALASAGAAASMVAWALFEGHRNDDPGSRITDIVQWWPEWLRLTAVPPPPSLPPAPQEHGTPLHHAVDTSDRQSTRQAPPADGVDISDNTGQRGAAPRVQREGARVHGETSTEGVPMCAGRRRLDPASELVEVAASPTTAQTPVTDGRVTVILTTSPVQSNPATDMLEGLLASFQRIPDLVSCTKIIVCDGVREGATCKYRSGVVTSDKLRDYHGYIDRLADLTRKGEGAFANTTLTRLTRRRGFGGAVKAALTRVDTPFVLIVQHDRSFVASFPLADALAAMEQEPAVKYLGLPTTSNINYEHKVKSRYHIDLAPYALSVCGLRLMPMMAWLDSTHLATAEHYRSFVFGPRRLTRGNFIEADLGQAQIREITTRGMSAHTEYGTYLLDTGDEQIVAHFNGRGFLTEEAAAAAEAASRQAAREKSVNVPEN